MTLFSLRVFSRGPHRAIMAGVPNLPDPKEM
jgi:hypothetical protein